MSGDHGQPDPVMGSLPFCVGEFSVARPDVSGGRHGVMMNSVHPRNLLNELPLDALKGFEAAARLLNFTRAGEELHVTQSAISHQMRALETRLGVRLFDRVGGRLRLTPRGELLRNDLVQAFELMRRGLARAAGQVDRPLRVMVHASFASEWLMSRLPRFRRAHPAIELSLREAPRPGIPAEYQGDEDEVLAENAIDVAVLLRPRSIADGRWQRLIDEYVLPCCAQALAWEFGRPIRTLDDFAAHTMLRYDDGMPGLDADWPVWGGLVGRASLPFARELRLPDWASIFRLAAQGGGVCMGRLPLVNDALRAGELIAPVPEVLRSTRAYYLLRAETSRDDARVQAFVDWIVGEAERERAFGAEFLATRRVIEGRGIAGPPPPAANGDTPAERPAA
jgi:LysR family glycine cleavage system transcriptional activator